MIERYIGIDNTRIIYGTLLECTMKWFDKINFKKLTFEGFDIMFNVDEKLNYDTLDNYVKSNKYMKRSYRCVSIEDIFDKNKTVRGVIGGNNGNGIVSFELSNKQDYNVFIDKAVSLSNNKITKDTYCIFEFPGYYMKN